MSAVAIIVFIVLAAIAAMHALWGLGLCWPARDEPGLVALVIGATGRSRMPGTAQCLIAVAAIFAAGFTALALANLVTLPVPPALLTAAGAVVALVFAGRGAAAYVPGWRARFSQQPFARLDRVCYGPLCLLLALAFAGLVAARLGG